jgi:hypothetical protein
LFGIPQCRALARRSTGTMVAELRTPPPIPAQQSKKTSNVSGQIRDQHVLKNALPHAPNLSGQIRVMRQHAVSKQSNLAPQQARPPRLCNPLTDSATALN